MKQVEAMIDSKQNKKEKGKQIVNESERQQAIMEMKLTT